MTAKPFGSAPTTPGYERPRKAARDPQWLAEYRQYGRSTTNRRNAYRRRRDLHVDRKV